MVTSNNWKGICLCLLTFLGVSVMGQPLSSQLKRFLREDIGVSKSNLRKIEEREVVTKALDTNAKKEVAIFGIVQIEVPMDFYVERFSNIERFKQGENVLGIGKFSQPPRLTDLSELMLEKRDLKEIRECRPGKCKVKLPLKVIERFQNEIDWSGSGYPAAATMLARKMLFDYVTLYLEGGNSALTTYNDHRDPVSVENEFKELLEESPYLFQYSPEFHEYLEKYPDIDLPGVEDFIYWSKEDLGLKPVTSLTHVSIYKREPKTRPTIIVSSKQIYANHYFEASLGLTALTPIHLNNPNGGFFLLYLNRSRANHLDGMFSGLRRHIVEGRAKSAMKKNMRKIKDQLETEYADSLAEQQRSSPLREQFNDSLLHRQ